MPDALASTETFGDYWKKIFTGSMSSTTSNQQRQSTEDKLYMQVIIIKTANQCDFRFDLFFSFSFSFSFWNIF